MFPRDGQKGEEGYGSLAAFVLSLFLASLFGALALMAAVASRGAVSFADRFEDRAKALDNVGRALEYLASRDARERDGVSNPLSEGLPPGVSVRDASSLVNPNWFPPDAFDAPGFSTWFLPGSDAEGFETLRAETGPVLTLGEAYGSFWPRDIAERFLTVWSPWPVNCADLAVLERGFALRTGDDEAAVRFAQALRERRLTGLKLGFAELQALAGPYWEDLSGVFTTEAPINVNYADPEVLLNLLLWKGFSRPRAQTALESLLKIRSSRTVVESEIPSVLGLGEGDPLLSFFGDTTLAWEVTARSGGETLLVRCLRLYQRGGAGGDLFADAEGKPRLVEIHREWL